MATVLVVDDARVDQHLAGSLLSKAGYETKFASNGREALDLMAQTCPDVVVTDLMMPEMDGLELVRTIRCRYPRVPVILMTGKGTEDTALTALRAGAVSFVPKLHLARSLAATVRSALLAVTKARAEKEAWTFLAYSESQYIIGYEAHAREALIAHFDEELQRLDMCGQADRLRVSTALLEALTNAIDHGNLELDSSLREESETRYHEMGLQRSNQAPYRDRRVHVRVVCTPSEVTYVVRDEGPGFNYRSLPDPRNPENLNRLSGRGILLIQTFMDEVRFNETGNQITMIKRRASAECE